MSALPERLTLAEVCAEPRISRSTFYEWRAKRRERELRKALTGWAFNLRASRSGRPTDTVARSLAWLERNTRSVGDLDKPAVVRSLLDALSVTVDGAPAAAGTTQRQRGVLVNAAEFAVERRLLARNPITALTRRAPRVAQAIDRRVVVNPAQARALLDAVRLQKPSGGRLVAFFGAMYYAAVRPGEAVTLRKTNLVLPPEGWGELVLEASTPEAGASWTDSGRRREEQQLKHRARGETRVVPSTPELTALLHDHLTKYGTGPEGCCSAVRAAASWRRVRTAGCGGRRALRPWNRRRCPRRLLVDRTTCAMPQFPRG